MAELETNEPSEKDYLQMILMTLMRIYDTNLIILAKLDAEMLNNIEKLHKDFNYIGPKPFVDKDE